MVELCCELREMAVNANKLMKDAKDIENGFQPNSYDTIILNSNLILLLFLNLIEIVSFFFNLTLTHSRYKLG